MALLDSIVKVGSNIFQPTNTNTSSGLGGLGTLLGGIYGATQDNQGTTAGNILGGAATGNTVGNLLSNLGNVWGTSGGNVLSKLGGTADLLLNSNIGGFNLGNLGTGTATANILDMTLPDYPSAPDLGPTIAKYLTADTVTEAGKKAKEYAESRWGADATLTVSPETQGMIDVMEKDIRKNWDLKRQSLDKNAMASNEGWMRSGERYEVLQRMTTDEENEVQAMQSEWLYKDKQDFATKQYNYITNQLNMDNEVKQALLTGDIWTITENYKLAVQDVQDYRNIALWSGLYDNILKQQGVDPNAVRTESKTNPNLITQVLETLTGGGLLNKANAAWKQGLPSWDYGTLGAGGAGTILSNAGALTNLTTAGAGWAAPTAAGAGIGVGGTMLGSGGLEALGMMGSLPAGTLAPTAAGAGIGVGTGVGAGTTATGAGFLAQAAPLLPLAAMAAVIGGGWMLFDKLTGDDGTPASPEEVKARATGWANFLGTDVVNPDQLAQMQGTTDQLSEVQNEFEKYRALGIIKLDSEIKKVAEGGDSSTLKQWLANPATNKGMVPKDIFAIIRQAFSSAGTDTNSDAFIAEVRKAVNQDPSLLEDFQRIAQPIVQGGRGGKVDVAKILGVYQGGK